MNFLLRIMTPKSTGQWVLWFLAWTALFDAVFIGVLHVTGQLGAMPLWLFLIIGAITCAPFLSAAMLMLRLHLRLQNRLFRASRTDLLTNMPNRRSFIEAVGRDLAQKDGVLMMIDVDHFKAVNDTYGHGFGDECLRRMADNIRPVIPGSFHFARLGGEEFAVMLFDNAMTKAVDIGAIIAAGIRIRPPGSDKDIRVTCSLGACRAKAGDDLSVLLSEADRALYIAKDTGRARMVDAADYPRQSQNDVALLAG